MIDCVPDSVSVLGVEVSVFDSYRDVVELVCRRISLRRRTFCVAINPEKVHAANRDARLKRVLGSAHIQICDGVGVSLATRILYGKRVARCTGVDLFLKLLDASAREGWKVFLLGATPETNEIACRVLEERFPELIVAGRHHGYSSDDDDVVERINASGANLLFIAMGSPRQELWINENMPRLRPFFFMGVGGSLNVVAGTAIRAPGLVRKLGVEWLFRLISEPSRWKRQISLPLFALDVFKAAILGTRPRSEADETAGSST